MALSRSQKGQSAIEILIAIALLSLLSTAGFFLIGTAFSETYISERRTEAQNLLSEGMEAVRQIRNRNFDELADGTYGLVLAGGDWDFSGSEDITNSIFHRRVTVETIDADTREVTVTIAWEPSPGRDVEITGATQLTNWLEVIVPSSPNCYGYSVSGDWAHPVVLGSADIGSGIQGSDVVVDLPYAYVSGTSSTSSKHDFFVFDVSNPASPVLTDSLDIGTNGINSLAIWEDHVYAASSNDNRELIVIDVSDPNNISMAGSTNLSGTTNAISILVDENLVALGREESPSYSEIYFYDVTNPAIPSLVGTDSIPGDVNDFTASEQYLYAVSSAASNDITIYDISDPLNPIFVSDFDLEDGTSDISIAYNDPGILFIGNTNDLFITVDATDPYNLEILATTSTGGEVKDMVCITGELLFLGTDNSNKEFMVLSIADVASIVEFSTLNFPQVLNGVDFADNMLFAAVRSNDALRIITSGP